MVFEYGTKKVVSSKELTTFFRRRYWVIGQNVLVL